MLAKATTSATTPPMAAPARKPSTTLLVARATAKPPIALSSIVPFIDRLMMPARSEIVSPITPKRSGAAAVSTPASPTRRMSALI